MRGISTQPAFALGLFVALGFTLPGCGRSEEIRVYEVAKKAPAIDSTSLVADSTPRAPFAPFAGGGSTGQTETIEDGRLIGAIIPRGTAAWYFKTTGPDDAVLAQIEPLFRLVNSLTFSADGRPVWTLPDGWTEEPGSGMRAATLVAPAADDGDPLRFSVIRLPIFDDDLDAYLLENVNRWRGQVKRGPLSEIPAGGFGDEADEIRMFQLADGTDVLLVNTTGPVEVGGPMSGSRTPPFAGRTARPTSPAPPTRTATITYDSPDGWTEMPAGGFRKASFTVGEGDDLGEVSVIDLPAAANELLPNVNRWRGQVGLSETDADTLSAEAESIAVSGGEGVLVELYGDEKAILGIIAEIGPKAWFVKMTAPAALARAERDAFLAFARSLDFDP